MVGRPRKKERSISINERILEDPNANEKIKASEIEIIEPGLSFAQAWFTVILQMAGISSPARIKLIQFMLENVIPGENILVMTQRQIAKKSGISYPTVAQTIQVLKGLGLVETRIGAIKFVTDQLAMNDDEMYLLLKFTGNKQKAGRKGGGIK